MGGRTPESAAGHDTIYEFNPDPNNETFILRPERLFGEKFAFAAFLIPDDYAPC